MRRLAVGLAVVAVAVAAALLFARARHGRASAPAVAIAPAPAADGGEEDAGLELAVAVKEPEGPLVCARARKARVPNAEILTRDFSGRTGDDGCLRLPPPTPPFTVCGRGPKGAACFTVGDKQGDEWMPITLELSEGGKLQVEVSDVRGRPIGGAEVTVSTGGVRWQDSTSPNGVATFLQMPIASFSVSVRAERFIGPVDGHAQVIASDLAKVRLRMAPGAVLRGVVVDGDGTPVSWSKLEAVEPTERLLFHARQTGDGGFVLDGLVPGPYDLLVTAEGFARTALPVTAPDERVKLVVAPGYALDVEVLDPDGHASESEVSIRSPIGTRTPMAPESRRIDRDGRARFENVPAGAVELVALESPSGCSVVATAVVDADHSKVTLRAEPGLKISGTLVDAHDKPLAGRVFAQRVEANLVAPEGFVGASQAETHDGHFTLRCLKRADYRLEASASPSVGPDTILASVPAGTRDLVVRCHTPAVIRGRVVGPRSAPIDRYDLDGYEVRSPEGAFERELSHLGPQDLTLNASGFVSRRLHVEPSEGERQDLGTITLTRATVLEGRVVDRTTHLGLANASISPMPDAGVEFARALTDSNGDFRLDAPSAAAVPVRVSHRDHLTRELMLGPGAPPIELDSGVQVHGHVLDASGNVLYGVKVHARRASAVRFATFDTDGSFSMQGLEPGEWTFTAEPDTALHTRPLALLPVTVMVPAEGLADLALRERGGGATVTIDTELDDSLLYHLDAWLVPGDHPRPTRASELGALIGPGAYRGHRLREAYVFDAIPEGAYTFVLGNVGWIDSTPYAVCHTEPLSVSGNGPMRWTSHPNPVRLELDGDLK